MNYAGKCAEAFQFYEKHLGGKIRDDDETWGVPGAEPEHSTGMEGCDFARVDQHRRHISDGPTFRTRSQ